MIYKNQSMRSQVLRELRSLLADLGKDGGKISPSIYDTAQRLRFYPPPEGVEPALDWLLAQQEADGGWCDPAVPAARDASTLAAILALKQYRRDGETTAAIDAGLAFLRKQARQWADIPLDGLPIAVEVILPKLICEANQAGLNIDPAPYARLYTLGQKKLAYIRQMPSVAGTPPAYSWEAFGTVATPDLLDGVNSVGHNPAATAKWLQLAQHDPQLGDAVARAEAYLRRAELATGANVPGVVPVIFPITGFELCYGPNAFMLTELPELSQMRNHLEPILETLRVTLQSENGISSGIEFVPDVDDTAVGVSLLQYFGYRVEPDYVMQFYDTDHFFTFARELNPSVFSNAHAIHALALGGVRMPKAEEFLLNRQEEDGSWPADKWHCSWRFTTLEVANALAQTGHLDAVRYAMRALLDDQHPEGYWSFNGYVSELDTAYSIMALSLGKRLGYISQYEEFAIHAAINWLKERFYSSPLTERRWLAKELYSIPKVEKAYVLAALLAFETQPEIQTELVVA